MATAEPFAAIVSRNLLSTDENTYVVPISEDPNVCRRTDNHRRCRFLRASSNRAQMVLVLFPDRPLLGVLYVSYFADFAAEGRLIVCQLAAF